MGERILRDRAHTCNSKTSCTLLNSFSYLVVKGVRISQSVLAQWERPSRILKISQRCYGRGRALEDEEAPYRAVNCSKLSSSSPAPPDDRLAVVLNWQHATALPLALRTGKRRGILCGLQKFDGCVRAAIRRSDSEDIERRLAMEEVSEAER